MDINTARRLAAIKAHPKYFLKYCCYTKDGNDMESPCKPFPYHLPYHQDICEAWFDSSLFIIEKSRQMQITWFMLGVHLWLALTGTDREIYVRRSVYDDAVKLLQDMEYIYKHIPESVWPSALLPRPKEGKEPGNFIIDGEIYFPQLNNRIYAVASGKDKMRGRTPSAVLLDEFAFQEDDSMVWQTLRPSAMGGCKVSIVSTPKPLFGSEDPIFHRIMQDRV